MILSGYNFLSVIQTVIVCVDSRGIGEIDGSISSSAKEIDTQGITIAADKKIGENKILGYAIQYGKDNADLDSSNALLNTHNYSLSFYGTLMDNEKTSSEGLIGVNVLDTEHIRIKNSNKLSAQKSGNQIFGSINFKKSLTPRYREAVSYTHLTLPTICSV